MNTVFISHSNKDIQIVNQIYKVLYQIGITPKIAEFEELGERGKLTALDIKDMMLVSNWCLVLLTPKVTATTHTQNWVSYEIGVAHTYNRPIWIFEHEIRPINNFPVPYLDYYFLYDPNNSTDWGAIKSEIHKHTLSPDKGPAVVGTILGAPFGPPGALFGALVGLAKSQKDLQKIKEVPPEGFGKVKVRCKCNGIYTIVAKYKILKSGITCPICRKVSLKF